MSNWWPNGKGCWILTINLIHNSLMCEPCFPPQMLTYIVWCIVGTFLNTCYQYFHL
jgi:hypothetical protein